jgi:Zn-dependent oligopeptidase
MSVADKAIEKGRTERYLPEKAWAKLSKEERRETDEKKKRASREGKQFVPNTDRARKARKAVSKSEKRKMSGERSD